MNSVGDVIDLDPVVVKSIGYKVGYLAVVCSEQPRYSKAVEDDARRIVPLYDCEIRVWDAELKLSTELPFETSEWEIRFKGGARYCFLPVDFEAEGPVILTFGSESSPKIVITGKRVKLVLNGQVGEFEERFLSDNPLK